MKTREKNIEALKRLCNRLSIRPSDVKIRPKTGSSTGITLSLEYRGATIVRHCDCADSRDGNFNHAANWLADLVRNLERRIETLEEAFHADGVKRLPEKADTWEGTLQDNHYHGEKDIKESLQLILQSTERLGLTANDVKVTWSEEPNEAVLRLRIGPGRIMEKQSQLQNDPRRNVAALALWLRARALHVERGIETIDHVASSYLQLEAGSTR